MKIDNSGYIAKAVLLIIGGSLFAFFPNIIKYTFLGIGAIIVIGSVLTMLTSMGSGDGGLMGSAGIGGILVGVFVAFLPKIITFGIGLIGGIVLLILGIIRFVKAFSSDKAKDLKTLNIIFGIGMLIVALVLLSHPFSAGSFARFAVGIVLIVYGIYNIYIAYAISERNKNSTPDVIDINNFTINDDDK